METKIKISIFYNNSELNNSNSEDIILAKESRIHNQHLNYHVIEENFIINDPTQNNSHQTSKNVNQYKTKNKENMGYEYINNKINGKFNDNNINQEKTTKKKSHINLNKINGTKHKYILQKANQNSDCYNKLNDISGKTNSEIKRREELNLIIEIFKQEIIKDIYVINNFLNGSSYIDQIKNKKRKLVKSLTIEIEKSKNNIK